MNFLISKNTKPRSKEGLKKIFTATNTSSGKKMYVQAASKKRDLFKFHKQYLFVDSNPGFDASCIRVLYGSFMYKKPKWIFPLDESRLDTLNVQLKPFQSNENGAIYFFPAHSFGFYCCFNSSDWMKAAIRTIKILLKTGKRVVVKLHPGDTKRHTHAKKLKKRFPSIQIPETIDLNNLDAYACVSDGGAICVKLALLGYPLFCFNKHIKFFLCRFASSTDATLLTKTLDESMFPSRTEFLTLVASHTFTRDEIKDGIVHRHLSKNKHLLL